MFSKLHVVTILFLFVTVATTLVALLTPYWWQEGGVTVGLWIECPELDAITKCFWTKRLTLEIIPDWHKAAIGLYTLATFFVVLATIWEGASLCCTSRGGGNGHTVGAVLMGLACVTAFITVAVVGAMAHIKLGVRINQSAPEPNFGWSYFLAIGSVFLCLVATILVAKVRQETPTMSFKVPPPQLSNTQI